MIGLMFLFLFRVEENTESVSVDEQKDMLLFIMPRHQDRAISEDEAHDEFDDPTLMSFANTLHGFSRVRNGEGEPPRPGLPSYEIAPVEIELVQVKRQELVEIYEDPGEKALEDLQIPVVHSIEVQSFKSRYSRRIVWLEDGIEKAYPLNVEDVAVIIKKAPPGRSVVHIKRMSTSHVFFLREKCGIAQLDALVLKFLRSKSQNFFLAGPGEEDILPGAVIVDWRMFW